MPAYAVFLRHGIVDPAEFQTYLDKVDASFEGHDVTFLADYGAIETLEGEAVEGAVFLHAAARRWYRSPAYQTVAQHRFRGARYLGFIVAGQ